VIGALLASVLSSQNLLPYSWSILFGLVSVSCVSFSNYVINEWFDRDSDRFHPINKNRVMVTQEMNPAAVCFLYFSLLSAGLVFAGFISTSFFTASVILVLSGVIYNIKPLRVKDIFLLDVLVDSFSSPLRFLLGWLIVLGHSMPPTALLLCFWSGGAYFMIKKRDREYYTTIGAIVFLLVVILLFI